MNHALIAAGVALLAALSLPRGAHAQTTSNTAADASTFVALRSDGNGVAALQARLRIGFTDEMASIALTATASQANLNLTFDPAIPNLRRRVTLTRGDRTVAQVLLAIAERAVVQVRVSPRGQVIVSAAPAIPAATAARTTGSGTARDSAQPLTPLRVAANTDARQSFEHATTSSALHLSQANLRTAPAFVEPDLLRAIQTMPGIAARSDWVAAFNVRGGEADQSLVLLDGHPVYNPFHLGGVFSTFIEPMVGKVELHTGALPARFGGRLSGVLDVTTASPMSSALHGSTHVSLLTSSTSLGRTFANGAGEWMIGGRRTYVDLVSRLFASRALPYRFQDLQARLAFPLGRGVRLALTGYAGEDVAGDTARYASEAGWRNQLLGATLSRRFVGHSDSTLVEQRISVTRFGGGIGVPLYASTARNTLTELRVAGAVARHTARGTTTLGYDIARQKLFYSTLIDGNGYEDIFPIDSIDTQSHSVSLHASQQWRPMPSLLVDAGARFDAAARTTGAGISPRLSLKYFATPNLALNAGVGRYTQWLNSLGREETPLQPLQFWVAGTSTSRASRAVDAVLGAERWITPRRFARVNGFYKRYGALKVPNAYADPLTPNDAFVDARGSAHGVDVLLRQLEGGAFSGWLSYAWTRSIRVDTSGVAYRPMMDRPHNLNLVGSWRRGATTYGVRANVMSGAPYTPIRGMYARNVYLASERRWVYEGDGKQLIAGTYNSERAPPYHRLDASMTRATTLFGKATSFHISIANVLNAKNPAGYLYAFDARGHRGSFPNLSFAPTVGLNIAY